MNDAYEKEFVGMTTRDVSLQELERTRDRLFEELPQSLDHNERAFLDSLHRLTPDWNLLGLPGVADLPAIKWKLMNLEILKKRNPGKFNRMLEALHQKLAF